MVKNAHDLSDIFQWREARVGDDFQAAHLPDVGEEVGSTEGAGADGAALVWAPKENDEEMSAARSSYLRRWAALGLQERAVHTLYESNDLTAAEEAMAEAHRSEGTRRTAQEEVAHASLLSAAIIENRKDMMRARRALAARGKAVSVAELQHFFYGQFRHTIEYRLLKLAMRVEEDLGEDDGLDDVCATCQQRGLLICCDGCQNVYHLHCVGLTAVPEGEFHCPKCKAGEPPPRKGGAAAAAAKAPMPPPPPPSSAASAAAPKAVGDMSISELKAEVRRRGLDASGCVEKSNSSSCSAGRTAAPPAPPPLRPPRPPPLRPPRRRDHPLPARPSRPTSGCRRGGCASRRCRRRATRTRSTAAPPASARSRSPSAGATTATAAASRR